jgi:hypothetical protein
VLDSFFSSLKKYEEKKAHNTFLLMLDPWFLKIHLVFSFVGCGNAFLLLKTMTWSLCATYVFEVLSSLTSCGRLWNWIYRSQTLWKLQLKYVWNDCQHKVN